MDVSPEALFNAGGTLASYVGLGATLLQWMASNRQSKRDLTVDEYLEWLRRNNHTELVELLAANADALAAIEKLLDDVKNSVLLAVAEHEMNSAKRHEALANLIIKARELDAPILKITTNGIAPYVTGEMDHSHRIFFQVVNSSNCNATITGGSVLINDGRKDLEVPIKLNWSSAMLHIAASGGAEKMEAETNKLLKSESPGPFMFKQLRITLAQEDGERVYLPAEEGKPLNWHRT